MNEEMEKGVVGGGEQEGGFAVDTTGAIVRKETAEADKRFDEDAGSNDCREQK